MKQKLYSFAAALMAILIALFLLDLMETAWFMARPVAYMLSGLSLTCFAIFCLATTNLILGEK